MKLPLLLSMKTHTENLNKDTLKITSDDIRTGMIRIGLRTGSPGLNSVKDQTYLGTDGASQIIFQGSCDAARGSTLKAIRSGILTIGTGCYLNCRVQVFCSKSITIGDGLVSGWDCTIKDNDGHPIMDRNTGAEHADRVPITIGNHVWLGAHATLLKGTVIPDGCIIGWGSIVTHPFTESHTSIAGIPARVIRENIDWKQ